MPVAPTAPMSPLRLREREVRSRFEPRDHGAADGVRRESQAAFRAFVDENHHLFHDYVARRLDGPHAGAAEDALQEGLIKIWHEWDEWPVDEGERIRFARQGLRIAALEAVRKRTGRDGSPRAGEIVVDFADSDGAPRPAPAAEQLARDLGRAIAAQSLVKDQRSYLEKASLVAAIATLTDLEQRVLFKTAQGDDCKEIALDLGVSHQQAREALMRARRLCRMLIEHADGQKVSEHEAKLLWQYRDDQLSGKRSRELRRHIDHCTACQRLLGLEESIGTNGALVVLPIPVLLLAAGKTAGGGAVAAAGVDAGAGSGTAAGGGGVGANVGGTLLAPAAPGAWSGSLLAGLTAKAGVVLAVAAVGGSVGGVYKLVHDREHPLRQRSAAVRAAVAAVPGGEKHDALGVPVATSVKLTPKPAAKPKVKSGSTHRTASRRHKARAAATTKTASTAPAATSPSPAATTSAPATRAPAPTSVTPRRSAASSGATHSTTPGGEFVLGHR